MSKISLSIPDDFLKKIDEYCEKFAFERSEFIRSSIRKEIFRSDEIHTLPGYIDPKKLNSMDFGDKPIVTSSANEIIVKTNTSKHYKGEKDKDYTWEWCQSFGFTHPFKQGELRKCLKVRVVDSIDGNPAYFQGKYFESKWMCKDCIEKVNSIEGIGLEEVDQ